MSESQSGSSVIRAAFKKRLITGSAWALAGKTCTAFFALAMNAILARLLSVEDMGVYFIIFTLVTVAVLASQLGLNQTVVRLVAESMAKGKTGRARMSIRISVAFCFAGALLAAIALNSEIGEWLAVSVFGSPLIAASAGVIAIWIAAVSVQGIIGEAFRGFHDIRLATVFSGFLTGLLTITLLLGLWILNGQADLPEVLKVTAAAAALCLSAAFALLWKKISSIGSDASRARLKEVFDIAWPLFAVNLMLYVLYASDIWILGMFSSKEEVAVYGAAARLMTLVAMPLMIVNAVIPPVIAEMYSSGRVRELETTLRTMTTLAGIPAFIVLFSFISAGNWILGLTYGEFYSQGTAVLVILSVGQLVNVWSGACGLTLMLTGYQFEMLLVTAVCSTMAVAGSLLAVNQYGATGIAAVFAATMAFQNVLMVLIVKKKTGMWTHMRFFVPRLGQVT